MVDARDFQLARFSASAAGTILRDVHLKDILKNGFVSY